MKYQLNPNHSIYLVTVIFESPVLALGLGLTDTIHVYAIATTKSGAEVLAEDKFNNERAIVKITDGFKTIRACVNRIDKDKVLGWEQGVHENA